jgi:carbonic anhydrase
MDTTTNPDAKPNDMTPEQAIARLKLGNVRFLNNLQQPRDPHEDLQRAKDRPWPFAAIVACMDSRVSTEMIFDLGIGDMFSLRMAGNVVTDGIIGSLEYAAGVVGTRLIVIMAHSNCGAVKAACDSVELGLLTTLLDQIQPAVRLGRAGLGLRSSQNPEYVQDVAEKNAQLMAEGIPARSPLLAQLVEEGVLGIVAATYDVATGRVRFLGKYDAEREEAGAIAEAQMAEAALR